VQGNYLDIPCWETGWPEETRKWRGHIYDLAALKFVARPMDKFFKYMDLPEINEDYFNKLLKQAKNANLVEKIDGTLIIVWYDRYGSGTWRCSTRGMIDFKKDLLPAQLNYHDEATKYLRRSQFYRVVMNPIKAMLMDYTFSFELLHPDNRIVSKYSDKEYGMYLISVRDTEDGTELTQSIVNRLAKEMQVKSPKTYPIKAGKNELDRILKQKAEHTSDTIDEGFVARFDLECGTTERIKFINDQYLSLKWIYSAASDNYYLQHLKEGQFHSMVELLPDDLKNDARKLYSKYVDLKAQIIEIAEKVKKLHTPGSIEFYTYVQENYNNIFTPFICSTAKGNTDFRKHIKMKHLTNSIYYIGYNKTNGNV
jgi:hypothetical protein